MPKTKTVYDRLLPKYKKNLNNSARDYPSAKRIKYRLMSITMWCDLTIGEMRDVLSYSSINTYDLPNYALMYGDTIVEEYK
tara:strand:- start:522 stop:764 length:243 start_codon:yes stop_codon:yes gene_type:complete